MGQDEESANRAPLHKAFLTAGDGTYWLIEFEAKDEAEAQKKAALFNQALIPNSCRLVTGMKITKL